MSTLQSNTRKPRNGVQGLHAQVLHGLRYLARSARLPIVNQSSHITSSAFPITPPLSVLLHQGIASRFLFFVHRCLVVQVVVFLERWYHLYSNVHHGMDNNIHLD